MLLTFGAYVELLGAPEHAVSCGFDVVGSECEGGSAFEGTDGITQFRPPPGVLLNSACDNSKES